VRPGPDLDAGDFFGACFLGSPLENRSRARGKLLCPDSPGPQRVDTGIQDQDPVRRIMFTTLGAANLGGRALRWTAQGDGKLLAPWLRRTATRVIIPQADQRGSGRVGDKRPRLYEASVTKENRASVGSRWCSASASSRRASLQGVSRRSGGGHRPSAGSVGDTAGRRCFASTPELGASEDLTDRWAIAGTAPRSPRVSRGQWLSDVVCQRHA
jgi:hypothetical protein